MVWSSLTGEVHILISSCTEGSASFHYAIPLLEGVTFLGRRLPGMTGGIKASQQLQILKRQAWSEGEVNGQNFQATGYSVQHTCE